ncbi:hypothetical protein [Lysinibacillus sp. Ag94]|uniref:XkdQ/YqbQ family protein n=1 Tax=Lysinibacillus sp. Ag94 TaxID=2936682 RepID=UPI00200DFECF|nr:hypothetical protein [Lysinibacillus sp. Ag94]UPW82722.1 hypothetical protein MY533_18705 [Lysinibacillus sp. Ag94]
MAHELWLIKGDTMTNITPMLGTLTWRSNMDELGDEINFSIAFNDTNYFPINPCDIGDMVALYSNGKEITRAIIVDELKSGTAPIAYIAFDYAFYLNKSTAVYQFNKLSADACIKKILADFHVPIGKVISMPTPINKIFNDKKVSEIIKEIITTVEQATGAKYLMEMRQGKLYIEKQGDLLITGTFQLFEGGPKYDIASVIMSPSKRRSIADMINTIQIVGNNDKVVLTKSDDNMVNKYGRLTKVVQLDQNEKKSAAQVAENELKQISKVIEENSVDLMGNDDFRAGRMFKLKEPITGINGTFLIKDVLHTISKGIHTMKPSLEVK